MIKILSIIGTRPEAIKMAPIIKEVEKHTDRLISRVCVTAQHRQMLDQVLNLFGIVPDDDLNVMREAQTPTQVTATVLAGLEPILQKERPDWVLVQGDTTTTAAAAWAAFYARIRVGHIEAGLRTFDKFRPFPEEINRRITSVVADLHFAPTPRARENLLREGVPATSIRMTGNSVIDALQWAAQQPPDRSTRDLFVRLGLSFGSPSPLRILLVTAHRRENFGQPLEQICLALRDITLAYPDSVYVVYPVHLNPNVQETAKRILGDVTGVALIEPLDYLPMVYLLKYATLVLTDSGGIQEEAPSLGKPVLVLRDVTERPEAVEAGTARVVGTDRACIGAWTRRLLDDPAEYAKMAQAVNPYGDGQAASRIVESILEEG